MNLLDRLERRCRRLAIPRLTTILVAGQSLTFILATADPTNLDQLSFIPAKVLEGEVWRVLTFVFMPPPVGGTLAILFAFFALYLLYLMGSSLENHWGDFRYNVFLLIAYLATIAASLAAPDQPATNIYISGSIFLAFAHLYPEFTLYVLLIFPVKIKYLAWITWGLYGFALLTGSWPTRALVLAATLNFLLFFGADIVRRLNGRRRQMKLEAQEAARRDEPFHVCAECGITDKTHPQMDFRYCPLCTGGKGYCTEHLHNHTHR